MDMTFDDYIINPMGIKNAVFSHREMYRTLYTDKLNKILLREVGKVKYKLYYDKKGNYYIHMKVPSEVVDNFYYDTLVKFIPNNKIVSTATSLKQYNVKFFSNDPSFVFTFAHAMVKNNLFIDELSSKMSKKALKEVGKEKNPKDQIGYVKSLYFTYLLAVKYKLFDSIVYTQEGTLFDKNTVLKTIMAADEKIESRQIEGQNQSKKRKAEKTKVNIDGLAKDSKLFSKKTSNINITKSITSSTRSSNIKRTSRTKKI